MDLLYARWQMGLSLAFHIIFAVIGMAMPVMMVVAEIAWLRTGRAEYLDARASAGRKGTAILFAVGAVSGTVLSFELGLLWPALHGARRARHRHAVLARGLRVLPRSDLPGPLSLRLGEAAPARARLRRRDGARSAARCRARSWSPRTRG